MYLSGQSLVQSKLDQATQILDELDIDLWLTFTRESAMLPDPALELISNKNVTWRSVFLISRRGKHKAIIGHFDADNVKSLDCYHQVIGYHINLSEPLLTALEQYDPKFIAINYSESDVAADGLTMGNYQTLLSYLQQSPFIERFVSPERIIGALRGRKLQIEVERIRQAIVTTEALFDEVEQFVYPGMTQQQIATFLQDRIDDLGLDYAWDKQYNPIVTCGPESVIGHAAPGEVILEQGHTLHIDFGVKQVDYCSDLQRTWYVLKQDESEAPQEVQHAFGAVYGAITAGEAALRPGVLGWQVDAAARQHILEAGYPEFMHAFGHLLGRAAHDGATVLGPRWERYAGICELAVESGNVFTLELHVVVPGRGIISLEEDVLVTENGVDYLSKPQTALRYVGESS
jgi:Xaa-Pro dipeptidase